MIFFDTETTGLILPGVEDPAQQPRIIELAAVSVCVGVPREEWPTFSRLINPSCPIPAKVTQITGLTDDAVKDAPPFPTIVPELVRFFRADPDNTFVAHNVMFDLWMLIFELRRCGWEQRFPYCWRQIDTVTESGGQRLENWAKALGVLRVPQTHRALDDVNLLIDCYEAHMREESVWPPPTIGNAATSVSAAGPPATSSPDSVTGVGAPGGETPQ
jgi:DNA polymerase III subunit epsilon